MPLFWFHESQGLPLVHLERVMGRYAGLYGDSEPGDFQPPCFLDY
jgi:thioesterase domain-containing protein